MKIDEYDAAEREATLHLSYPATRAFWPAAFAIVNFPSRVREEVELIRYADIMNELDDRNFYYRQMLYSDREISMMRKISDTVEQVTGSMGRIIQPFMSKFPPIDVLRAIYSLRPRSVLEIGPGAGYLGAYLIHSGINYCAVDNTQSLYIWQNRFFSALGADLTEHVAQPKASFKLSRLDHVPWWQFAQWFKDPPNFDIVVCDAALGEMDQYAANYVIKLASIMLADSDIGAFLFRHAGEQRVNSIQYLENRFAKYGLSRTTLGPVNAYSRGHLQIFPPEQLFKNRASDHLPVDITKLMNSYEFFDFIDLLH